MMTNTKEKNRTETKSSEFEVKLGTRIFGIVGILAVVLGLGFFTKLVIDNGLISELTQLIIACGAGILITIAGLYISDKKDLRNLGLIITSGGIAVVSFATYAAYHFEYYRSAIGISLELDLALLTFIVIASIGIALFKNSKEIAIGSFLLGYAVAALGASISITTLIYISVLAAGLVFTSTLKNWKLLNTIGVVATYTVFIIWYEQSIHQFLTPAAFLIAYFTIFNIQTFLTKNKDNSTLTGFIANGLIFASLFFINLLKFYSEIDYLFALSLGVFYGLSALHFNTKNLQKFTAICLVFSIVSFTLAIFLFASFKALTIYLMIEVLIIFLIAYYKKIPELLPAVYLISGFSLLKTVFFDSWLLRDFAISNLANSRLLSFGILIAVFYFIAFSIRRDQNTFGKSNQKYAHYISWSATMVTLLFLALELSEYYISIAWAVFGLSLIIIGFIIKHKNLRLQGIAVFAITIIKVFIFDTAELSTGAKTISYIALGIILLGASFIYHRYRDKIKELI